MILFRPVGKAEYDLIAESGFTAYPPRLPEQPIFYPVLNERYAREIAEKWNRRYPDSQYTGYVTTFEIDDTYISQFSVQTVGASYHQEFWIPAEELDNFNRHIIGKINIIWLDKFQFDELFRSNDTERVRTVTKNAATKKSSL